MARGRNDYETAQIQGRLWTPAVLRPAMWFDAADLSTISISTGISEWRDKSGNARHLSQATSASQPSYRAETLNGLGSIQFPTTTFLDNSISAISVTAETAIVLLNRNSSTNTYGRFWTHSTGGADYVNSTDYVPILYAQFNANNIASYADLDVRSLVANTAGEWVIWSCTHTGSAITNRTPKVTGTSYSHSLSKSYTKYGIGTYWGGSAGAEIPNSYISEVIYATSALSQDNRQVAEGYLAWKWGLTNLLAADHPFANRPPMIGD